MHVTGWCLSELLYWETAKENHAACVSEQWCVGAGVMCDTGSMCLHHNDNKAIETTAPF